MANREKAVPLSLALRYASLIASLALLFGILWLATMSKPATTFRIDARTSTASIVVQEGHPAWPEELKIQPFDGVDQVPDDCEYEGFQAEVGATITLEAPASESLALIVTNQNGEASGQIYCSGSQMKATGDYVVLNFGRDCAAKDCQPPIVRFIGDLTIGASISERDLTPAILENAALLMETDSLIPGFGRIETPFTIDKGDRLSFSPIQGEGVASRATGLLADDRLDDEPLGFRVIARVEAREALVLPFGPQEAEPIAVAPTFVERLQSGAQGLLLGLVAAVFLHTVAALTEIVDYHARRRGEGV